MECHMVTDDWTGVKGTKAVYHGELISVSQAFTPL